MANGYVECGCGHCLDCLRVERGGGLETPEEIWHRAQIKFREYASGFEAIPVSDLHPTEFKPLGKEDK
jgi:hypothetical protein